MSKGCTLQWWGIKNTALEEFPGGPVAGTWCFHCRGLDSVSGWGTKILQATEHGKKKKKNNNLKTKNKTLEEKKIRDF